MIWINHHLPAGEKVEYGNCPPRSSKWTGKEDRWYDSDEEWEVPFPLHQLHSASTYQAVRTPDGKVTNADADWEQPPEPLPRIPEWRFRSIIYWARVRSTCRSVWNHLANANKVLPAGERGPPFATRVRRALWVMGHAKDRFEMEILEKRCPECGSLDVLDMPPAPDHMCHSICQECNTHVGSHWYYGKGFGSFT
jgi:hypothetical protein